MRRDVCLVALPDPTLKPTVVLLTATAQLFIRHPRKVMELDPLQDGWSKAIRAVFGAFVGMVVATVVWAIEPADQVPSFLVLSTGLALAFALGTAIFGHAFWRAISGHSDG